MATSGGIFAKRRSSLVEVRPSSTAVGCEERVSVATGCTGVGSTVSGVVGVGLPWSVIIVLVKYEREAMIPLSWSSVNNLRLRI